MKLNFSPYPILTVLVYFLITTGCGGVSFTSLESSSSASNPKTTSDSGNGGTYDGKLRVLHHYVNDFTCEGKSQPESILIRKNATDWFIIRSTKQTCAVVDQAPVSQVVYDDVIKIAKFEGHIYIPPKPYIVDPNEDPNLPDVKVIDGVCEDVNGKCSLRASLENAGLASWTSDVIVSISSALFKLSKPIRLETGPNSHSVQLQGYGSTPPVLDGQNASDLLKMTGWSGSISVDNMTFQNGAVTSSTWQEPGLAISLSAFNTKLIVSNSSFINNTGSNTFYSIGTNDIEIINSKFIDNLSQYGTLFFFTANSALVDRTTITGSPDMGIQVLGGGITKATITNSFIGNGYRGIILDTCSDCKITNTTIANNSSTGLKVYSFRPTPNPDVLLNNVTLYNNGSAANESNLEVAFQFNPTYKVILNNSILAHQSATVTNCYFSNTVNFSHTIIATNSLFDDASCTVLGSGNIYGNPQLALAANNGGPTLTLLPALTSPALNAGDLLTCSSQDQRGYNRAPKCDIGAVEIP